MMACQFNLYKTDRFEGNSHLYFDCLNYYETQQKIAYQELRDLVNDAIPYCFRPENKFNTSFSTSVNPSSTRISFEELYSENVTAQTLLSWSIPIALAEDYQLYLNERNPSMNKSFYNCTERWFGLTCQYSFDMSEPLSFNDIVNIQFRKRKPYDSTMGTIVRVPCYTLLECHRNGYEWCLDWREICDGTVDCFDEGTDEESCFDLEVHECGENEFRCHNGLCISDKLWEEGEGDADCLDRSDVALGAYPEISCYQDPKFHCEEKLCRTHSGGYSCGDGQCAVPHANCQNGRERLLINYMTTKGSLNEKCWIAMVCLTELDTSVNDTQCQTWEKQKLMSEFLAECDPFFQFPTVPLHAKNVRFFYRNINALSNRSDFYVPQDVCYDKTLCSEPKSKEVDKNLTCLYKNELAEKPPALEIFWGVILGLIHFYFGKCSNSLLEVHDRAHHEVHPALHQCRNSSKMISKHRILDRVFDCFETDDENYADSCLLNQPYRVRCKNSNQCWSPLWKKMACLIEETTKGAEIRFQSFCNGVIQYYYTNYNNKELHDELNCQPAWCNNIYAVCDGFWGCADGRDEINCTKDDCPPHTMPCLSPLSYSLICLEPDLVNNNSTNCFGGTDEYKKCFNEIMRFDTNHTFLCKRNQRCISTNNLCDGRNNCEEGEDEGFCDKMKVKCATATSDKFNEAEQIFCKLNTGENKRSPYFSVRTQSDYPNIASNTHKQYLPSISNENTKTSVNLSHYPDRSWPWLCHRGLGIRLWNEENTTTNECLCPPAYYGDRCQFQSQRVSLTLRLAADNKQTSYTIVMMLIDVTNENYEIDAYEQFVYVPLETCSVKIHRYLLFSMRSKNVSNSYVLRIDAFDRNGLIYVGSWYYPIDFLFLPVNSIATSLEIMNPFIQTTIDCHLTCIHGECIKYLNKEKFFCRCLSGWSGMFCHLPTYCESCSSDALCVGASKNQSICVCPSHKFGERCLIEIVCPVDACLNGGRCVLNDISIGGRGYSCICLEKFTGPNCEFLRNVVHVSISQISAPSFLIAYFFTLSNQSDPISSIVLRKLTLFQSSVTFYIRVSFHLMIIQAHNKYYLAALQRVPKTEISTLISSAQECLPAEQLLGKTILSKHRYERVVPYYELCRARHDIQCFVDEEFFCLCTNDHHANCLKFVRYRDFQCPTKNFCENGARCLQDHPTCPLTKICACPSCFFGNRCQFYAKGLGSTLDEILGYEIRSEAGFSGQSFKVKISAGLTILISVGGVVSGIFSIMTFSRKNTREVGCGIYLLASSITSLLTTILFFVKFWLLFLSQRKVFEKHAQQLILNTNCLCIEPLLRIGLYLTGWFNVCVALERSFSLIQGINFVKSSSRLVAKRIVILLPVIVGSLFIPQFIYLQAYEDEIEERTWCVVKYSPFLQMYNLTLMFIHYFVSFFINIISALVIIIASARQRARCKSDVRFWIHLLFKLKQQKHIIISPVIIILLSLPHLIISMVLDCSKSSNLFWFYLAGYFLSFVPTSATFIIFILLSPFYRKTFQQIILRKLQSL